jgi:Na+-driven multidrug efflux pump
MVPFGTIAVSAHSLSLRVQQIVFMPGVALGNGAGVVVGQNLGAGEPARAERSGWLAVGLIQTFVVACSVTIFLSTESIVRIFNFEPDLVRLTGIFLKIAVVGYLVVPFVHVLPCCISGAGDTFPPMIISLLMIWLVQLPLASLLPRVANLGVYGVRWAIVVGMLAGAAAYAIYFRLGRWKRQRI